MHPEMLRELTDQRGREMRARARQGALARLAIRAARHGRSRPDRVGEFVMPAIPDYVDGSFRTEPAGQAVASEAGQAPAGHTA